MSRRTSINIKAGEPVRPEPHDLAGAILFFSLGAGARAIKNWNGVGAGIN